MNAMEGMNMIGISFPELLRFDEQETEHWHQFLAKQGPGVLDIEVDLGQGKTLRDLLLHVFGVELKYAERLSGGALTRFSDLPARTVDEIFSIATRAQGKMKTYLKTASEADLNGKITFPTLSAGEQTASRRKVLGHALFHSLRHWAQLTTEMRRRGYKAEWHHDLLFTDALK
jgi:uncharacterized damage-inducible protein DinB